MKPQTELPEAVLAVFGKVVRDEPTVRYELLQVVRACAAAHDHKETSPEASLPLPATILAKLSALGQSADPRTAALEIDQGCRGKIASIMMAP